jgi:hypothetical protein
MVILLNLNDNSEPNGKSSTISRPYLNALTMGTAHASSLYTMQAGGGLSGFRGLVIDYTVASIQQ